MSKVERRQWESGCVEEPILANYADMERIVRLFEGSEMDSFELECGDVRLKMAKHSPARGEDAQYSFLPYQTLMPAPAPATESVSPVMESPDIEKTASDIASSFSPTDRGSADASGSQVTAPLVGIFYAAPSPGELPFVSLGDAVKKGQTLCIIEAMKVMNEIPAPCDGRIVSITAENGKMVSFGESLMVIEA